MKKNKGGRPKWIPGPEEIKRAESFAALGLTEEQVAAALGICHQTLIIKKKEYIEFSEAIKSGKAKGIVTVASALMGQVHSGNVTAMIFYLKSRAGWAETSKLEHTGKDGDPIQHDVEVVESAEHWGARMAELIRGDN